jgi:hypothetical protein
MSPVTVDINQIRGLYQRGLYKMIGIKQEVIQHTIDFILLLLTSFGVINSPDNKGTL